MKTANDSTSTLATDAQYGELKTMFERTARAAAPGKDGVQNLIGRWDKAGPAIAAILARYSFDLSLVDSDLLDPITILSVAGAEAFSAKEKFAIGTQDGVKIEFLGDNFKANFLSGPGKIEIDVPDQGLRVHKLRKSSVDGPIIGELGTPELIETNLATMFELMKKQGAGQPGDLLTSGYANIFYVRDDSGTLWAVDCRWDSDGGCWGVGARSVANPGKWRAGIRVFSR